MHLLERIAKWLGGGAQSATSGREIRHADPPHATASAIVGRRRASPVRARPLDAPHDAELDKTMPSFPDKCPAFDAR